MKKGAYCLVIRLGDDTKIKAGRMKALTFPAGFYIYVGSAMKNPGKRIKRHLSKNKRFHWHIDWLLHHSEVIEIFRVESDTRIECEISTYIEALSHSTVSKGFGSSDCRCNTHLHFFKQKPVTITENSLKQSFAE